MGNETEQVQHFDEFGVVMMLVLVGLELKPQSLWEMRHRLLGLGGIQVVATAAAVAGGSSLLGIPWKAAVAIGLIFSLSSTAIVLQTLGEKGLAKTEGGRASFAVLLFQDIAVIPMLALIPLLAIPVPAGATSATSGMEHGHQGPSLVDGLPAWLYGLVVLGAVAAVVGGGHYVCCSATVTLVTIGKPSHVLPPFGNPTSAYSRTPNSISRDGTSRLILGRSIVSSEFEGLWWGRRWRRYGRAHHRTTGQHDAKDLPARNKDAAQ